MADLRDDLGDDAGGAELRDDASGADRRVPRRDNHDDDVLANESLYVSHFPCIMSESLLQQLFAPFGKVRDITLKHSSTQRDWGPTHAFVHFENPDSVRAAIDALNGEPGNAAIKALVGDHEMRWRPETLEVKHRTFQKSKPRTGGAGGGGGGGGGRFGGDERRGLPVRRRFEPPDNRRMQRPLPPAVASAIPSHSPPRRPMVRGYDNGFGGEYDRRDSRDIRDTRDTYQRRGYDRQDDYRPARGGDYDRPAYGSVNGSDYDRPSYRDTGYDRRAGRGSSREFDQRSGGGAGGYDRAAGGYDDRGYDVRQRHRSRSRERFPPASYRDEVPPPRRDRSFSPVPRGDRFADSGPARRSAYGADTGTGGGAGEGRYDGGGYRGYD